MYCSHWNYQVHAFWNNGMQPKILYANGTFISIYTFTFKYISMQLGNKASHKCSWSTSGEELHVYWVTKLHPIYFYWGYLGSISTFLIWISSVLTFDRAKWENQARTNHCLGSILRYHLLLEVLPWVGNILPVLQVSQL